MIAPTRKTFALGDIAWTSYAVDAEPVAYRVVEDTYGLAWDFEVLGVPLVPVEDAYNGPRYIDTVVLYASREDARRRWPVLDMTDMSEEEPT